MLRPSAVCYVHLIVKFSNTLLVDGDRGVDTTFKGSPVEVDLVISGTSNSHLWRPQVLQDLIPMSVSFFELLT